MNNFFEDNDYATYPMSYVYEFADIIHRYVNAGVSFWNYDIELASAAAAKFCKISLLHVYTCCQLHNYHNRNYRKNGDCYETEEYEKWVEIATPYGIKLKRLMEGQGFYKWYQSNSKCFELLFEKITDEVFFLLFANKAFLNKFNLIISELIKDSLSPNREEYHLTISKKHITAKGKIKRTPIPQWVKKAVFCRDRGRCVCCNKDLSGIYTKLNQSNLDHIIPLNQYGANDPCNIQLMCEECNKSKQDKSQELEYKIEKWW